VVGVVTQDAHMFHDTLRANLLYAQAGRHGRDLREALRSAQVCARRGAAGGPRHRVGDRGYRSRAREAARRHRRLLLKAPDVVVLDEATAHLDSESEPPSSWRSRRRSPAAPPW